MNYRVKLFAATLTFLVVSSAHFVPHSAGAQIGGISEVTVAANRDNYLGLCPAEIRLKGQIKAQEPLGVVRHQFVHSDGTQSAVSQLTINGKGQFTVEETLRETA